MLVGNSKVGYKAIYALPTTNQLKDSNDGLRAIIASRITTEEPSISTNSAMARLQLFDSYRFDGVCPVTWNCLVLLKRMYMSLDLRPLQFVLDECTNIAGQRSR